MLRERLVADAGAGGDLHERIDALVEREAGVLDEATRAELARRVARRSFGLGPLEPLLADPAVDEVMVCGPGRCGSSAAAGSRRPTPRSPTRPSCATRSSGSSRRSGAASTRPSRSCDARLPDGSRVNVVIPPLALDGPVLTIRRFRPRGFDADDLVANGTLDARRCATCCARAVATALQRPRQRRHRLGQDDDAQRAVVVHRRRRADRDDRGRRRAAPRSSATSCASRRGRRASRAAAR